MVVVVVLVSLVRLVAWMLPYQRRPALRPGGLSSLFTALRIPWRLAQEEVERLRSLLFADQGLEELARMLSPGVPATVGPGSLLTDALIKQRNGDAAGAERALRDLLRREVEMRWRLWAAQALRDMGCELDGDIADELMGIVAETPMPMGLDSLAVYSDGNVRYIN